MVRPDKGAGGSIHRIEVDNFKSYKGHHVIGPFKQFTAVIGPNGSGKSNLMDAISFVTGIRSAQLRGNMLSDLIYHHADDGDDNPRKAYVTMVFVTKEGEEVHFTRTITASGSSDYKIDKKVSTWNAYNARLESFGVLVKARNFLVFQGDVEMIAQKSPKDLTTFFEQISGSDELKKDYEELEAAKLRSDERTSFLFSKKKTMAAEKKHTKLQKEEAERHFKLQEELKNLKAQYFLWQLFQLDIDSNALQESAAQSKEEHTKAVAVQNEIEREVATLKKDHQRIVRENIIKEKNVEKAKSKIEEQNPMLVKNKEELKRAQRKVKSQEVLLSKARAAHETREAEVQKLQDDLNDVMAAEKEHEAEMASEQGQDQFTMGAAQLQEYNRCKEEAGSKTYKLRQDKEVLVMSQQKDEQEKSSAEDKITELDNRLATLDSQAEQTAEKSSSMAEKLSTSKASLADLKKQMSGMKAESQKSRAKQDQMRSKLDHLEGQLREAKADQKESERDKRLANTVDSLKHHFPGVRGRLMDLIKVSQRKHNLAVTVALGKHMDAIVVADEKTAKECIMYLKEQRLANLTFIPLQTIRVKPIDERMRQLGGTAKLVLDVMSYDPSIERALLYAVGVTLVCDTHQEAKQLCYGSGQRYKVVSLDGTLISKSGVMTGGTSHGMEAKAAHFDRQVVEKLKQEHARVAEEMNELGTDRQRQQEEEDLRQRISRIENEIKFADQDVKVCGQKSAKLAEEKKAVAATRQRLQPEVAALAAAIEKRAASIATLTSRINEIQDRIFAAFSASVGVSNIREYEETRLAKAQGDAERRMQFTTQIEKLRNQLEYEQRRDTLKAIAANEAAIQHAQEDIDTLTAEEREIKARIDGLQGDLEAQRAAVEAQRAEAEAAEGSIKAKKDQAQAHAREAARLKSQCTAKDHQLEQLAEKQRDLLKTCHMEQVDIGVAGAGEPPAAEAGPAEEREAMDVEGGGASGSGQGAEPIEDISQVDFAKLNGNLRRGMEAAQQERTHKEFRDVLASKAGDLEKIAPNLRALEQYEVLKERERAFAEELEASKQETKQATEKFNSLKMERTRLFVTAFEHVAAHIDPIYKELTRKATQPMGGNAYLSLENADEPFLHGVKFTAMPPTKRFRDMEQLSGGEKTVAALALLFSVHSYRPSPFFVLDEVDAALDNINVDKVAAYILSKSTQTGQKKRGHGPAFQSVVISLKDSFYEKATALIGVNRDPKENCSRTFSFDLERFGAGA